jgi:predicted metal-dependent hydrolase
VTVCLHDGIVLTLPERFDDRRVPALLAEWRPWIDRQLKQFDAHRATLAPEMTDKLPSRIVLPAMARTWSVEHSVADGKRARIREQDGLLQVSAADRQAVRQAVQRWLARTARVFLQPELDQLAAQHGFEYRKLTVRSQRTRWGSCSSNGTISLNSLLMFLAPDSARAVLLHELCHTRYMSHGPRFYGLLERLEPRYRELDRQVRNGWQAIPAWAWPPPRA